jgi:hypothetical protein
VPAFRKAAPNTFFTVGIPHGDEASTEGVIRRSFAEMTRGADAIYSKLR